jgi:hypothetical protein
MTMNNRSKASTTVVDVEAVKPVVKTSMKMYVGATLTSESRTRDGFTHGWQVLYPHFDPLINIQVPGSKTCLEDGEIIKSNECNVD